MTQNIFDVSGKVALITGASSGLGAHFARALATAGAQVAVAARRADKLSALVAEIENSGDCAFAVKMDVTDTASVEEALERIQQSLGPVDILVNNAGVASSNLFAKVSEADWDFVMNTNLKGVWRVGSLVANQMLARGAAGSIINVASILGLRVGFGESAYATSKAAVVQMTKNMALELGRKGIRVNALCPGYFQTELNEDFFNSEKGKKYISGTPAGRLGDMKELSGPLLLLASDAGSFINGVALPVDGGHLVNSL